MPSRPNPDDRLVLLEVAKSGRFTRAAEMLGLNHVIVSRRIAVLERALGGKVLVRAAGGLGPDSTRTESLRCRRPARRGAESSRGRA